MKSSFRIIEPVIKGTFNKLIVTGIWLAVVVLITYFATTMLVDISLKHLQFTYNRLFVPLLFFSIDVYVCWTLFHFGRQKLIDLHESVGKLTIDKEQQFLTFDIYHEQTIIYFNQILTHQLIESSLIAAPKGAKVYRWTISNYDGNNFDIGYILGSKYLEDLVKEF